MTPGSRKTEFAHGAGRILPDWLSHRATTDGERLAFAYGGERITYRDWELRSNRIASALDRLGFRKGDVLALLLPPRPEYALCYLAAAKLGGITTGVNPRFGEREIDHILRDSGARFVVAIGSYGGRDLAGVVRRLGARISTLQQVFVVAATDEGRADRPAAAAKRCSRDPDVRAPALSPYAELELQPERSPEQIAEFLARRRAELDPEDLVALVYTSGTTGQPKAAAFQFANLEAVRETRVEMLQEYGERVLATGTPFSHIGFMSKIASAISDAQTTFLLDTFKARTVLETIERERIGYIGGVPAQWSLLLMDPELDRFDLSSLRVGAIGGAPFSPELVRQIRARFGIELVTRYSCTETAVGTGSRPGDSEERLASTVGRASDIAELRIVDEQRAPLPTGEVGEVAIRSPAVMRGYWKQPELTAAVKDEAGFYYTGDLGVLDEQGYLRLVGRKKEMYIRGGYNVYPVEVEAVLGEHPAVAQVAVLGVGDPVLGERGVAVVVARPRASVPSGDELREFARGKIADYKLPDRFLFRDELPLTPGMKVDKRALRDLVGG